VPYSDWHSPFSRRALRIHIIRRTGALPTVHPFLGHPWFVKDSDSGIAWGVLTTPSIMDLLRIVRGQDVEEEIRCPRYLIGATGEGAAILRQKPDDALPLPQLIFLNRNDDICAWLLTNKGHDPLDLMVLSHVTKMERTWTKPTSLPMGGIHFLTMTSGMSRLEEKTL